MNSKRFFFGLIGVILLLGLASIGGVYFGSSLLSNQTDAITKLRAESLALDEQQKSLIQAKRDVEQYTELEKIVKTIVPQEKNQARTVREIVRFAQESGIKISTITFPASTLGQDSAKSKPAGDTSKTTPSSTTQVKPVEGISGVQQLELTVQSDTNVPIPYSNLLDFLTRLEQNRRTSQVSNINVQPAEADRTKVTFTLIVNVYVKQ